MKVSIKANKLEASSNNVRGLCTVTFGDSFAVRNISIVESKKGLQKSLYLPPGDAIKVHIRHAVRC